MENIILQLLSPTAHERLNRIKLYNKERGITIENKLMELYQSKQIINQINDNEFIKLLEEIESKQERKEIKVSRRKNYWDLDD